MQRNETINDKITPIYVGEKELRTMFSIGRSTALKLGKNSKSSIKVGGRRLYNVEKIKSYLEELEND